MMYTLLAGKHAAIQVTELAVLGLDLLGVDLGVRSHQLVPPFHLIHLRDNMVPNHNKIFFNIPNLL